MINKSFTNVRIKSEKRLNEKNGNIKTTLHHIEEKNIDEAIEKLSNREKENSQENKSKEKGLVVPLLILY